MTGAEQLTARVQGAVLAGMLALPRPLVRGLAGRPVIRDEQLLEPEAQLSLRLMSLTGSEGLRGLTPGQARARVARDALSVGGRGPRMAAVRPVKITGGEEPLEARLYDPGEVAGALVVYFHGGGFVVGDLETHDATCRFLAHAAGVRVLAIDYRLGPEHRFPAAAEDAWTAFTVAAERVGELGAASGRIAVAGDSAGGNLAAGVAQRAAQTGGPDLAFQLLIYPWLDLSRKRRSYQLFGQGFYLTEDDLDWYASHYLGEPGEAVDPRCSPLLADGLSGVAPAFILTAGFDPLRDEGEEYAERLRAAGVRVALRRHEGLFHGFANAVGAGRAGRAALLEAAGALRYALAPR